MSFVTAEDSLWVCAAGKAHLAQDGGRGRGPLQCLVSASRLSLTPAASPSPWDEQYHCTLIHQHSGTMAALSEVSVLVGHLKTAAVVEGVPMCLVWELAGMVGVEAGHFSHFEWKSRHFPGCSRPAWSPRVSHQAAGEGLASLEEMPEGRDFIFWWKAVWTCPPQITCLTTYRFKCVDILFCILNKCYIMGTNLYYTVYGIIKKLFHYFLSQ